MLLAAGGGGLSVAFDMPTLMGRDSDDPQALGETGHCGVAIDSAADMDILFDGIDLESITTSMTISGPAVPIFCMYLVAAERQGADISRLDGTLQTDIFKEYIAQKEWLFPPEPHLRLIGDLMEFCSREIPRYKPLSVSGYHIREAGATAAQELAFTLADGFGYVELGKSRGLDVNQFARTLVSLTPTTFQRSPVPGDSWIKSVNKDILANKGTTCSCSSTTGVADHPAAAATGADAVRHSGGAGTSSLHRALTRQRCPTEELPRSPCGTQVLMRRPN